MNFSTEESDVVKCMILFKKGSIVKFAHSLNILKIILICFSKIKFDILLHIVIKHMA